MNRKKDKIKATIGTIAVHILVLLALIFFGLSAPFPPPGEEGVEVNLGYTDVGMGNIQKEHQAPSEVSPPPEPATTNKSKEELITQETEEAPAIEKKAKTDKEKTQTKEKVREKPKEETKVEPEKPKINPDALYKGKSDKTTEGSDEGETGQSGDQGNPFGSKDVKTHDGTGGAGNGISFSLGGRSAKHLPKPEYKSKEQGKIVVSIWVNRNGVVTKAMAGAKGTTIADLTLRRLTEAAALKARFSENPNAPEVQKGTITYNFIILN